MLQELGRGSCQLRWPEPRALAELHFHHILLVREVAYNAQISEKGTETPPLNGTSVKELRPSLFHHRYLTNAEFAVEMELDGKSMGFFFLSDGSKF